MSRVVPVLANPVVPVLASPSAERAVTVPESAPAVDMPCGSR